MNIDMLDFQRAKLNKKYIKNLKYTKVKAEYNN